jgi:hypothetical protein
MTGQDTRRILKIDEQLLELEDEIKQALEFEKNGNRTFFLASKTLRTKYEQLYKRRNNLMRSVHDKVTRQQTYDLILQERKKAALKAEREVVDIKIKIEQLGARVLLNPTAELVEEFKDYKRLLASKKLVLLNKERAVINWLDKDSSELPIKRSTTMRSNYGKFKEELKERIIAQDIHKTPQDLLETRPNWNLKAENNAGDVMRAVVDKPYDFNNPPEILEEAPRTRVVIDE